MEAPVKERGPTAAERKEWRRSFTSWLDSDYGFIVDRRWDYNEERWILGPSRLRPLPVLRPILDQAFTLNEDGELPYRDVILSLLKKSGKTAYAAAITLWYAWSQGDNNEIYVVANDLKQAEQRVWGDILYSLRHSPWINYKQTGDEIELLGNGTKIIMLGQHYKSAAGSRHGMTCWDELWGYTTEYSLRMWDELTHTPTANSPLRLVVTYAGYKDDDPNLLWEQYLKTVGPEEHEDGQGQKVEGLENLPVWENGRRFGCWFHDPVAPWQDEEYYEDERTELRPGAYQRFHKNEWAVSKEQFINEDKWNAVSGKLDGPLLPNRDAWIWIAVDPTIKGTEGDTASGVGVYYDPEDERVKQAFHKIWRPTPDDPLDLELTMEQWIIEKFVKFRIAGVAYDPFQFHRSATTLEKKGINMIEFPQTDPQMIPASENLFSLLQYGRFWTYDSPECTKQIMSTVGQERSRGLRIVKDKGKNPNDYAIALAMSAYLAIDEGYIDVSQDLVVESNFADTSAWPVDWETYEMDQKLPPPLRSYS